MTPAGIRTASRTCGSIPSSSMWTSSTAPSPSRAGLRTLLYVYVDVEPVSFNRGFYTVDMRFFYHVTLQAYLSCPAPVTVEGLCVFDKRAILFGSEGNAKIFSSKIRAGEPDTPRCCSRSNLPDRRGGGGGPHRAGRPASWTAASTAGLRLRSVRGAPVHQPVLRRRALQRRRRPPDLRDPGPVLHRPSGAGFPAPDPGL